MKPLRVLNIEDSEDDAELLQLHLTRAGYEARTDRVQTADAMKVALAAGEWDVIISDYRMPNFTGLEALEVLKETGLDIPFILISGTIGEETAVGAMLAGVSDYLMKDKLARLVPAIERGRKEAAERRARRQAESDSAKSEERYRDLFENANDTIFTCDLAGNITSINKMGEELTGYPREEILGMNFVELFVQENIRQVREMVERKLSGKVEITRYEVTVKTKNNNRRNVEISSRIVYNNGIPIEIQGIAHDITERKQLEKNVLESEKRLHLALTAAEMGVWEWNIQTDEMYWSPECYKVLKTPEFGGTLQDFQKLVHPEDLEAVFGGVRNAIEKHAIYKAEFRVINSRGELIWVTNQANTEYAADGTPHLFIGTVADITERKQAEQELRESEENFRALVKATTQVVWTISSEGESENNARWWLDLTGQTYDEAKNLGWLDALHPADRETARTKWSKAFRERSLFATVYRVLTADGEYRYYAARGVPVLTETGTFRHWIGTLTDITERKSIEQDLRESEARLRLSQQAARVGTWEWNIETDETIWSDGIWLLLGLEPGELPLTYENWMRFILVEDIKILENAFKKAIAGDDILDTEFRIVTNDGRTLWLASKGRVIRNSEGKAERILGVNIDITERKQAEEDLHKSEEKLRQAQKLESIGRLAGGIAHDFNNMLTAINGYSDLLLRRLPAHDPHRDFIMEIREAGERSAALTHQLLAFSRRQILQPEIININNIVSNTTGLLQRLIGEDIQIISALSSDIGQVKADPGQMSQVIMNLAVNSRDAMPQGGTITIETENIYLGEEFVKQNIEAEVGNYVLLAVSDNGTGMDSETLLHIFEPFYTTKDVGKGTGLGLATVHGIVNQSGGWINVVSTVGTGTTFEIYLPSVEEKIEAKTKNNVPNDFLRGSETILLVEDEQIVRNLIREVLESCGYRIIEAKDGEEALKICETDEYKIDLLLTDVVMPKMGGYELVEKLSKEFPRLRVLFTSGYTEDSQIRHDVIDATTNFIHKPFTPDALASKVREILNDKNNK